MQPINEQPNKKKKWYTKWWGILLLVVSLGPFALLIFLGMLAAIFQPSEEASQVSSNVAVEKQKNEEEQRKQEAAVVYQKVIDTYAPIYCANHQDITVNEPTLHADGWPMADNQKGITGDECKILIGLLYLQRDGYANRESWIKSVSERNVAIGMTKVETVYAWGSPNDINKTTTSGGTREQWVFGNPIYSGSYVYFDNDIVTSIQN